MAQDIWSNLFSLFIYNTNTEADLVVVCKIESKDVLHICRISGINIAEGRVSYSVSFVASVMFKKKVMYSFKIDDVTNNGCSDRWAQVTSPFHFE